jgi:GT2 family glycosyltransferase
MDGKPRETFAGITLIRKDVFDKVGGFDPDYFIYFEEPDLSWRIWLSGYRILIVPTCKVIHIGHKLGRKRSYHSFYLMARNRMATLIKNSGPLSRTLKYLLILSIIYILYSFLMVVKGRKGVWVSFSYIRALLSNIKGFKGLWRKKLIVEANRKVRNDELAQKGLIINIDFHHIFHSFKKQISA